MRTRTSFQKRQKEIARAEKQRDKAAKRLQKKLMAKQAQESGGAPMEETAEPDEESDPIDGSEPTP